MSSCGKQQGELSIWPTGEETYFKQWHSCMHVQQHRGKAKITPVCNHKTIHNTSSLQNDSQLHKTVLIETTAMQIVAETREC